MSAGAMIELKQVCRSFDGRPAVADLTLAIAPGDFTVLIGSSGSGKSTTLKMINRLIEHDSGSILFAGEDISRLRPEDLRRRMGYAIQSIGLFPHWTVERNIATVPQLLKWPAARIRDRVTELLTLLQLDPALFRQRYPHQLSGGQQQRVGVARALAADPDVLLMDEPFGALDPLTRQMLQGEMRRIHRLSGKTIVLVTHDIDEALALATRVVLLDGGRLVQAGTPRELLQRPANDFVRDFLGRDSIGLRLLGLTPVRQVLHPDAGGLAADSPALAVEATLQQALSRMAEAGVERLRVAEADGRPAGHLRLQDLLTVARDAATPP
jgi:osmoprotectant transport system ATP-binding protein